MQTSTPAVPPGLHAMLDRHRLPGPVTLSFAPAEARFCLRIAAANRRVAAEAFGVELPATIGACQVDPERARSAVCLGPDEWVLYAAEADVTAIGEAFAERYARTPHSLVDISDREITLSLEGAEVITLLCVGCPADPRGIAVGEGRRTVFDGATVVLRRDAENAYRMDVWRSFLPHVWDLLNTANRELATGF